MSAGGSGGTATRPAADHDADKEEEEEASQAGSLMPAVGTQRKRKGDTEERQSISFQIDDDLSRSEGEDQQVKMKCFRVPHCQAERRRREKINNLIKELSAMIPACQPMAQKLDRLTVLRKAVQHLKALKAGARGTFTDSTCKPSILPHDDLRQLLLKAAEGFLLVVRCDRAKILFISESVSKILNFSQLELTGQSLFDFIHPKDITKVKEQLSSSETLPHQLPSDASTRVQAQEETPVRASRLASGARRSFFCRMKHSRVAGKNEDQHSQPGASKKKDSSRYCTLHCTGYMRSWPSSQLDPEGDVADTETSNLNCLVTMCRLHPHISQQSPKGVNVKTTEFVTRCAIDGKFTFEKCPESSRSASSREEAAGSSSETQTDSRTAADARAVMSEGTGESIQLAEDMESMFVPGLSSFSSDEATMEVIVSLLETDINMGQPGDFEDLNWHF
uniref:Aryl hydrocarbon receptor nuclear translocator-like 2 n=1 Tax=Nothobranchius furzeri TaxID=105023 RepID=A0A1A8VJW2_NOTFU